MLSGFGIPMLRTVRVADIMDGANIGVCRKSVDIVSVVIESDK